MNTKQQGFTLIELVVVIVILGILAAVAVPKFVNLQGDARTASMRGVDGSVSAASALIHAKWLATNTTPVPIEGGATVTVSAAGYPTSDAAGIGAAMQLDANAYDVAYTATTATYTIHNFTPTSGVCNVVYTASTGIAAATVTGC
jgi:MSHA pilin protein MshA